MDVLPRGHYRHYKGKDYEVIGIGRHSETGESLVIYQALYGAKTIWVRPLSMFLENVQVNGITKPRFKKIKNMAKTARQESSRLST